MGRARGEVGAGAMGEGASHALAMARGGSGGGGRGDRRYGRQGGARAAQCGQWLLCPSVDREGAVGHP